MSSVTYSIAYKRALPKYENITVFFSLSQDVPDGKTPEQVKSEVVEQVDSWLEEKVNEIDNDLKG